MTSKDKERIRELAKQQREIAESPKMEALRERWYKHHTFHKSEPMVTVELGTFADEILPPLMQCEDTFSRQIEWMLLHNIANTLFFHDDTIVRKEIPIPFQSWFIPFGIPVQKKLADGGIGHHFVPFIEDLEKDYKKLQQSEFGVDKLSSVKRADQLNELIGDILPARVTGKSLYAVPTQDIVHLMSMETLFISLFDCPELFLEMLNRLTDDYLAYFGSVEKEGLLGATVWDTPVAQGSYCFTDSLPSKKDTPYTLSDIWGFLDSQETVGISPQMFAELIFPSYKKIAQKFGHLSYGCCEPVDSIWENCLSTLPNLRKLSISPWCNEEYMGEQLAGKKIIYHRKPSPNFIGVGTTLDEEALRKHIARTVKAARGCAIEFTQRDVYTVNKDMGKVKRFVEIIREESSK